MKIQSSAISMSSNYSMLQTESKQESLKYWVDKQRPDSERGNAHGRKYLLRDSAVLELSDQGKNNAAETANSTGKVDTDNSIELSISNEDRNKIALLERLLEKITGKKIKFFIMDKIKLRNCECDLPSNNIQNQSQSVQRQGWGLEYEYHEKYYEKETLTFNANGLIQTSDGRSINFSAQMNLSREFASQTDISMRAGDAAIDPLVINFDGSVPELTDKEYVFDLDSDGSAEDIHFVTNGSGFLALDKNGDNIINNGKELFGPNMGNGFDELKKYDSDNNNWIDENDPIYENLRIWTKDENGNDCLFALGQKGIGAIYLGNIATQFNIKNTENQIYGKMKASSVFVKENGEVGTIHQIDLAV